MIINIISEKKRMVKKMRILSENEIQFKKLKNFKDRVVLKKNKTNPVYVEFVEKLLPAAQSAFDEKDYTKLAKLVSELDKSFRAWRKGMALSAGIYLLRENDLQRGFGYLQSCPDKNAVSVWNSVVEMTDIAKNSDYMTDKTGEDILYLLKCAADDLVNGVCTFNKDRISRLAEALKNYDAYFFYTTFDTKSKKSQATVFYCDLLDSLCGAISDNSVTAEEISGIIDSLEKQRLKLFEETGTNMAFIENARKVYAEVSKDLDRYTKETAKAVSDAMNACDIIKPYADDVMCQEAITDLKNAIDGLCFRKINIIKFSVDISDISPDFVMIDINVGSGSDLAYAEFFLYYDSSIMEFIPNKHITKITSGYNCLSFYFDKYEGLCDACTIVSLKFIPKNSKKLYPVILEVKNPRTADGLLAEYSVSGSSTTLDNKLLLDSKKISLEGVRDFQCNIYDLMEITDIPERKGFVFGGWNTSDKKKILDKLFVTEDIAFYPEWNILLHKKMRRGEIMFSGYIAVHPAFAVEDDFKKIKECGLDFIILDYVADSECHEKCLNWAEKYGIYVYIHDSALNAETEWTTEKVLHYTLPYRDLPIFLGNDYCDEPSHSDYPKIAGIFRAYIEALPGYDIHVNLFSDMGVEALLRGMDYDEYIRGFVDQVPAFHLCIDPYPLTGYDGVKKTYDNYYTGLHIPAEYARKYNMDFWTYIQTMKGNEQRDVSLADIRFQYYSSLAYGADKIMNYCYDCSGYDPEKSIYSDEVYCMRDYAHRYTKLYDYVKLVNSEIKPFSLLYSEYLWQNSGVHKGKNPVPGYVAAEVEYKGDLAVECDDCVLIGSFSKSGGGRAYMLCNATELSLNKSICVKFTAIGASAVKIVYRGMIRESVLPATITLESGEGAFIAVTER